ncbi:MAG: hypothetical protein RL030_1311, partial [Pseudomonadota bacterium]
RRLKLSEGPGMLPDGLGVLDAAGTGLAGVRLGSSTLSA